MSTAEWELKHKKPSIRFKRYVWICSNGYAHGWGQSPDVAYRAFKRQQASKIEVWKMLAKKTKNIRKQECTHPAYSSYDIYENAEEQDRSNEKILQCYVGVLGLLVIAMFVGIALS